MEKYIYLHSLIYTCEGTHTYTYNRVDQKGKKWSESVKEEVKMSEKEIRITSKQHERDLQPWFWDSSLERET